MLLLMMIVMMMMMIVMMMMMMMIVIMLFVVCIGNLNLMMQSHSTQALEQVDAQQVTSSGDGDPHEMCCPCLHLNC